jgi:hypothetical protein
MQILTTEHWSLLASRGLAWNETFARAGMYLSTLSGAMVALGLVAGVDKLGDVFVTFALVILPVVLFVGIATFLRMGAANYHDAMTVHGMNRIRAPTSRSRLSSSPTSSWASMTIRSGSGSRWRCRRACPARST